MPRRSTKQHLAVVSVTGALPRSPRRRARTYALCLAVSVVAGVTAACGSGPSAPMGSETLRIAESHAPLSLDPALTTNDVIVNLAYAPLLEQKPDGSLAPGLATSWQYASAAAVPNTVFELTLRSNAKFSDGSPVTAQSVKQSLEAFAKAKGPQAGSLNVKSVDAIGPVTVRINLGTPNPNVPLLLSNYVNAGGLIVGPNGLADPKVLTSGSDGAGPYRLDPSQTVAGDHYTLVPNSNYYDKGTVVWSKITVKIVASPTSILRAMQAGQFDVAEGDQSTASAAEQDGLKVVSTLGLTTALYIADRNGTIAKPLADARVRQALSYSIDRKAVCRAIYGQYGAPTSLPEITLDGTDPAYENYYSYDVMKAKELIGYAGYPDGFPLPILGFPGAPVQPLEQPVLQYFKAIGVNVNLVQPADTSDFASKIFSGNYPAYFIISPQQPAALRVSTFYLPTSPFNPFHVSDPVVTSLYNDAIRSSDASRFWKEIYGRVVTEGDSLGLCSTSYFWYSAKNIGNLSVIGSGSLPYLPGLQVRK